MNKPSQNRKENELPPPRNLFLRTPNRDYTYSNLYQYQKGLKQYLANRAFSRGEKLLLISELSPSMVFTIAACWNLHIPFVSLSPDQKKLSTSPHLAHLNIGCALAAPDVELDTSIPTDILDQSFIESCSSDQRVKYSEPPTRIAKDSNQIFGVFYSSGSSGAPKLIPLKRRQLYHARQAAAVRLKPAANHSWMLCLPPYHIGGTAVILRSLGYGNAIHLVPRFEKKVIKDLLKNESSIQAASMVPTMLRRLLDLSDFEVHTNFKGILLGGGPIDSSLVSEATGRGIPVINSYGMTETCAQITSHRIGPETAAAKRDSVGKVFTPNQIQIRSENGEVLESDQTGLIWLKGPQVFDGYIEASLNEHHFDPDGWFNTGDYGYMDRKGYVYISMRRTDQIVSGGKNINPHEIEQLLLEWSQIKEVAVVGIPDTEWGEQAIAVVIPADSDHYPTYESLKRYLESRVESYKIPKSIAVRDQLPKTPVGKIKRIELKKELANSIRD